MLITTRLGACTASASRTSAIGEFRELFELNVVAPLVAVQAVIPIMREQGGGVIINISSRLSKLHIPALAGYASTKYMVNALTFTACEELTQDSIRVCLVIPGKPRPGSN